MNNQKLLRILGGLVILVLAFVLTKSIFFNNIPLSIEAEPTGPQVIAQNPIEGQRLTLEPGDTVLLESLFSHAKAGNSTARSIFRRAGRYLAVGLANVVNLFDPALIILSGERMRYDYLYAEETLANWTT